MSKLKVFRSEIEATFLRKLQTVGFEQEPVPDTEHGSASSRQRRKSRNFRAVKHSNEETDIFLYPGVKAYRGGGVVLDPVVGVENLVLREIAQTSNQVLLRGSNGRVCHKYLLSYGERERPLLQPGNPFEEHLDYLIELIEESELPQMCKFDSAQQVRILFRKQKMGDWSDDVAVLGCHEKLRALQRGWD